MTNAYSSYTENMAEFGFIEIKEMRDILNAWLENGLPKNFCQSQVRIAFNKISGFVFLTNEDYQAVMLNGVKLEIFHTLPHSGEEGFLLDLMNGHDSLHPDDVEYLLNEVS